MKYACLVRSAKTSCFLADSCDKLRGSADERHRPRFTGLHLSMCKFFTHMILRRLTSLIKISVVLPVSAENTL